MFTPKTLWGFNVKAKEGAKPSVLEENSIGKTILGKFYVKVLRWEIEDFEISELDLTDGHFITFELLNEDVKYSLYQQDTSFYVNHQPESIKTDKPPKKKINDPKPIWHKCDHFWPSIEGIHFTFICQFYYAKNVCYLFYKEFNGEKIFAIFQDNINRQDIEEHYLEEEKRMI